MDDAPVDIVDRDRPLVVEVAADTCDRCGHRAFLYAELRTGSLAYCAHHGTEYLHRLTELGAKIVDLRHLVGR
ncbi:MULTISPECIES: DUF7455 domain-containing protein [unclassified Microbacterium]|uniref:DUF7455 domain-containing protein n=1 Tax=unclassified Microbacterium TaxID=2609290 RepID=UPI00301B068D